MNIKIMSQSAAGLLVLTITASAITDEPPALTSSPTPAPPAAKAGNEASLLGPLHWKSSGPLISPNPDEMHKLVSIKDPTVVHYGGLWHVYATTADSNGSWHMVYLNFTNWSQATSAKQYYMDNNPNLRGYHCAPQVFYFRPQKKWYLIFQSGQPQYSTSDDISKPETWTKPKDFFRGVPASVVDKSWLDFWVICDRTRAYLFFSGDNGRVYRSQVKIEDFPNGMSDPVIVMQSSHREDLFEGGATYRLKGKDMYLTIIEAIGSGGRYYRGFVADSLDGPWRPLADTWENPFAGMSNVTFDDGVKPWTKDVSHGELIRDGYDETLTVDPANLELLYQGRDPASDGKQYSQLPYRLGLLHLDRGSK